MKHKTHTKRSDLLLITRYVKQTRYTSSWLHRRNSGAREHLHRITCTRARSNHTRIFFIEEEESQLSQLSQ